MGILAYPIEIGYFRWYTLTVMLQGREWRKYYRHPISAPLKLRAASRPAIRTETSEISLGGLSFIWQDRLERGDLVDLSIPIKDKLFEIKGRVTYCIEDYPTGKFRMGILFMDSPSAFRAKLAEEALEILRYRKEQFVETGAEISEEEAARQWIQKFAKDFPDFS